MSETLKPLTLGEILDRTVQLYRRNFAPFAGIAAVPALVTLVVTVPLFTALGIWGRTAGKTPVTAAPSVATVIGICVGCIVFVITVLIATVFSQAALIRAAVSANTGQRLTVSQALGSVRGHFWRYVGVLVLQGLFAGLIPTIVAGVVIGILFALALAAGGGTGANVAAGFAAFFVGAAAVVAVIVIGLGCSLAMPACIAEDKPAWDSLQRSWKLSKGSRGRIFLMFLLVWALAMVVTIAGYIVMMIVMLAAAALTKASPAGAAVLIVGQIVNMLINLSLQTLVTPIYVTALVLFYYDQRIRTEGYDIEWMMQQAGLAGSAQQPVPAIAPESAPSAETSNG